MCPSALSMIGRKKWSILTMAVLVTLVFFVSVDVKRNNAIKKLSQNNYNGISYPSITESRISTLSHADERTDSPSSNTGVTRVTGKTRSCDEEQASFEDVPPCVEPPYLLILVTSAPGNLERREAIRKSWASTERWKTQVPGLSSKTVFLAGKSPTNITDLLLKNESDIHRDILIGDYVDTYRNLTVKVMHGYSWAERHCQSTFLLKTDDDSFINVPLLLQFLVKLIPVPDTLYAGSVYRTSPVVRDPKSRWYVASTEHARSIYAPYAFGAGYILGRGAVEKLVLFSKKVPTFSVEDAYVGTVMQLAGVKPINSARFLSEPGPKDACSFMYSFVVHRVKAAQQSENQDIANKAVSLRSMDDVKDWVR